MTTPCPECPFRRGENGPVRLTKGRIREIAGMMLSQNGSTFHCHKTTTKDDEGCARSRNSVHCAGALIFAEKNGNATQMMRIAERLGLYDHTKLVGHDQVFNSIKEMLKTAI